MNVILRPRLTLKPNTEARFDVEDRAYWPYKVTEINNIRVKHLYRQIFINKDFDQIGYSKKGSKWINEYQKENIDGSVEVSNRGFKYLIFQHELKQFCKLLQPKTNPADIGMNMTFHKEVVTVKPELGKVYLTKNGALVKLVAFEAQGPFAKEPTFIGLIRRPGITDGGTPYQCDVNGKAISHGGHEHYHLMQEQKSYTIYTYSWLNPAERENLPVVHVAINTTTLPTYLRENPDVKYNVSVLISEF